MSFCSCAIFQILDLPSQLFYKNKLSCKAKFPGGVDEGPVEHPSVKFVCVEGQEMQDEDSPSYYNAPEAIKVAEEVRVKIVSKLDRLPKCFRFQAQLLIDGGLRGQDICVLTYYSKQVQWIRSILRQKKQAQVSHLHILTRQNLLKYVCL